MSDKQREVYLARMAADGLSKGLTGVHNARASLEDVAFFKRSVLLPSPLPSGPPSSCPVAESSC